MKIETYANAGAVLGTVLGGISWAVIAAMLLRDSALSVIALALCAALVFAGFRFLHAYPERRLSVFGALVMAVIAANAFLINRLYDAIPSSAWGVTTGKGSVSLFSLNCMLAVFGVVGAALVAADIVLKHGRSK